jgi:hypothetical protein
MTPQRRRDAEIFKLLCVLSVSAVNLPSEIIDRIAVRAGNQVITESRVLEDLRMAAFLNGEKPDFSPASKRQAAGRLVERILIRREMELTQYPLPAPPGAGQVLEQIKGSRFSDEARYREELARYGIAEPDLTQYLLLQAAILRFVDARFKPEIQVSEIEIRDCYENRILPEYRKRNLRAEPSFDDARNQCEEMLAAERVDKVLERWLKETKDRTRIVYQEDAFQ